MAQMNKISCPNCGQEINVDEVLSHQLQDELKKEYGEKLAAEKKRYEDKAAKLEEEKEKIEAEKSNLTDQVNNMVKEKLEKERKQIQEKIRAQMQSEQEGHISELENELKDKSNKLKELNKAKAQIQKLEREKDELRDEIEAETQKKINEEIRREKMKIRKSEEERSELRISEKEHVIEQLKEQLKVAQRKAEQGSMQVQGEVQEIAIEEYLKENFPFDTVDEIKKGAKGADCIQIVNTRTKQNCGSIYYESKRTKDFQKSWIEKFKNDMRNKRADIGVIVTDAMPRDMERMGQREGIWICSYVEFKGLCFALRDSIIQISNAVSVQENKGDKMNMLYDYLTSNEFRLQIEGIVEGFTQMHEDLEREKRSIQGHWKRREKQIQKVLLNTNHMYSSIKGIAGKAIQPVRALELSEPEGQ